jgi:hypothetical protein
MRVAPARNPHPATFDTWGGWLRELPNWGHVLLLTDTFCTP